MIIAMSTDMEYIYDSFSGLGEQPMNATESVTNSTTTMTGPTCEIQGPPLPLSPALTNALRYIQLVYYFSGLIIGLILSLYLITLIAKFKKLRNMNFYLVLQIVSADLILCITLFPTGITSILANNWVFGISLCPTIGMVIVLVRHTRNFLMFVLAIDRLCSVFLPFWFVKHRKQVIIPLSAAAWFLAFILAFVPVTGLLDCYQFQRFTWYCIIGKGCNNPHACEFFLSFTVSVSVFSLLVSLVLYLILLYKAKKLNKTVVPNLPVTTNSGASEREIDNGLESAVEQSTRPQENSEKRATITFLILFLALFGVVFPSFLFFIIGPQIVESLQIQPPPSTFIVFAIIFRSLFSSLAIIDPIALMRNADVREVNSKVLVSLKVKFWKKCQ